uniref:Bromodomain associated domain-containing protein n=1 Tax=Petromyzon marinus TaxID=7757 RepID=S4RR20_PETMA
MREGTCESLFYCCILQVCQGLGWDAVQVCASEVLTDVLQRYLEQLARCCHRYSELYGRTDPDLEDVGQAFGLMGVSLHELEDFVHNLEPVAFAHTLPAFPAVKANTLGFPTAAAVAAASARDAASRRDYIPDHLPPLVSAQEGCMQ